jgi:siroheme synthase (precorrin-2 oxidase/ferrochelatase)
MKVVVIGTGSIGRRHIANLLKLEQELELTVVDPSGHGAALVRSD